MRRTGIIVGIVLASSLGFADGEALARAASPHVVSNMSEAVDPAQLQSAALAWIRTTVSSPEFIAGVAAGVVLAEIVRFAWRWLWRAMMGTVSAAKFVIHHRLVAVVAALAGYYAFARYVFG
jgi:hypothetical protein